MTSSATSFLSRSSSAIIKQLRARPKLPESSAVVYTISSNATNLDAVVSQLSALSSCTVGCVSAPLPGYESHVSCSIATFSPKTYVQFHSDITGREKTQVGRWRIRNDDVESQQRRTVDSAMNSGASWPSNGGDPSGASTSWDDVWGAYDATTDLPTGLNTTQSVLPYPKQKPRIYADSSLATVNLGQYYI